MSKDLSDKQQVILDYLKQETMAKGYPPSVREICEAVGLKSTSTVHGHLERLEKKGFIRRDPTKPRAIEIFDEDFQLNRRDMVHVPILGKISAGQGMLAEENIEDYFPIPVQFAPNATLFMLRVQGDSMINKGIFEDDLILVQQQNTARNGDVVAALINDEMATVKTFYKEIDHIRLQPENDYMEPIIVNDALILGKVVGLYRQLL